MTSDLLKTRTEAFARQIVRLCLPLLEDARYHNVARHLLRTGTAAHANYGSALRGRSPDEFTGRLGQACDDIAEAREWLDRLSEVGVLMSAAEAAALRNEAEELSKILGRACRETKQPGQHDATVGSWDENAR